MPGVMSNIHLLQKIANPVNSSSDINASKDMVVKHGRVVIPWLWLASHCGFGTSYVQWAVSSRDKLLMQTRVWLEFQYTESNDLEDGILPGDEEVIRMLWENEYGVDVLEVSRDHHFFAETGSLFGGVG